MAVWLTWNTVSRAIGNVLKFVGGVPSSKLNCPPNSCIPSNANISMNKNSRKSNDMIDLMELSNDITRFLNEDQYLECNDDVIRVYKYQTAVLYVRPVILHLFNMSTLKIGYSIFPRPQYLFFYVHAYIIFLSILQGIPCNKYIYLFRNDKYGR